MSSGTLDDIRIYNRELSSKEAETLWLICMGPLSIFDKFLLWLFPRQFDLLQRRHNARQNLDKKVD